MEAKDKIKYGAFAYSGMKFVQQVASDLSNAFAEASTPSILSFGVEQYSRIGSSIASSYTLEQVVSSVEKLIMPKFLQGALAVGLSTLGAGFLMHHFGKYFDYSIPTASIINAGSSEQATKILDVTKDILKNYYYATKDFVTFNSQVNGGYLAGALFTVKSLGRLAYNMASEIAEQCSRREKVGVRR